MNFNLALLFAESARSYPYRPALWVNGEQFSYAELRERVLRVSGWICRDTEISKRVGILASRSADAYIGVLGTLWSGGAYVPIDAHIPPSRLVSILERSKLDALVADEAGAHLLTPDVLEHAPNRLLLGVGADLPASASDHPRIHFSSVAELSQVGPDWPVEVPKDALAYILFTSGTTGTPKGVMIEAGSVYLMTEAYRQRYDDIDCDDRVAHIAALTFDASLVTMTQGWMAGGSLHVVPHEQLMAPGKFLRDHKITAACLVPSIAVFMQRLGMLKPRAFPDLRHLIFGGEALPVSLANAFQMAAPSCCIENQYGPTESTVLCLWQYLTDPPLVTPGRGTLAIGDPLSYVEADIVDSALNPLPAGDAGELIIAGPALARGYPDDPAMTARQFPTIKGKRWYRTGDRVYRDESGKFYYLGRIDNQVKILGNRIELEGIEAHLRQVVGSDLVAAVAWPMVNDNASALVAFHCCPGVTANCVRAAMKLRVPEYMVPQRVHCLQTLPLGSTGKIDRKALTEMLDRGVL